VARTINRLTAIKIEKLKEPGLYPDGAGLYLQVTSESAKSWLLKYCLHGKSRQMGLGSLQKVGLAEARKKAADNHRLLEDHIDPIAHRHAARAAEMLASADVVTFKEAAARYLDMRGRGLQNAKHAAQWRTTIGVYAEPILGNLPVADINVGHVHRALEPIWTAKPETASRVRGRIERILGWCKVNGYREGENPARWRDNLDNLLPKLSEVRTVRHHPSLPYTDLPTFMEELRGQEGIAARALEFTILTAARTEEVILARPTEINKQQRLWVVPPEHMKRKREHLVPLCDRAIELLAGATGRYLFPSPSHPDNHLSNMAMLSVIQRINESREKHGKAQFVDPKQSDAEITVHGFRSTFKDYCRDKTRFENFVSEAALAHASGDKIEVAYARSDVLDKRRKLMAVWASFCTYPPQSEEVVIQLRPDRLSEDAA
jgi:integrase